MTFFLDGPPPPTEGESKNEPEQLDLLGRGGLIMIGDDCEDLPAYLRGDLCPQVERRFRAHLGGCDRCARELLRQALREHAAGPSFADRAQEAVVVGRGLVQLGREVAGCLVVAAVRQLVPPPVREWINWQGGSARWSVR